MILKEGFFSSIALLVVISCLAIPQIAYINPVLFFLAIFLAIFLNPILWGLIVLFSMVLGLLLVESIIGGIASLAKLSDTLLRTLAAGGIAATILGIILKLPALTQFISTIATVVPGGKEILAIMFLVGLVVPMVLKVLLFFVGLLLAIIFVPFSISSVLATSYATGFYLLFFFLLFYYYLYGNDLALYGIIIMLLSTSIFTSSIYLALGVVILSFVGVLLGIRASVDVRNLIIKIATIYYITSMGVYAGSKLAELNTVFYWISRYGYPIFTVGGLLSPVSLIALIFVLGIVSGDLRWPKLLINLMALYSIYTIFGPGSIEEWLYAYQNVTFTTSTIDVAINSFLSYFGTDASTTFWMYRNTVNILVGGFTDVLTNIFHIAKPYFLGFSMAFAFLIMLFLYDMMLGLTGYPIFEGLPRVIPAVKEAMHKPPVERKAKEVAGVVTGLAETEKAVEAEKKKAIEKETKELKKVEKEKKEVEKELKEKTKELRKAVKKGEEQKVWTLSTLTKELRARRERLERIERAKQVAIRTIAQYKGPTVAGEVQRSLETTREALKSIKEKLRRKK
jgi:hypothetical protein